VQWDLLDQEQLFGIVRRYQPAEIYHLAALSSGSTMFENPVLMAQINGLSVIKILEAIRLHSPDTRFCQASSSEIFGSTSISPQAESTPPIPMNPYGASKLYVDNMDRIYQEKYGIFACSAILYNHESPRRPLHFVTRKITNTAA
jgi:GDPmannose 4,6-dehydratase